MMDQQRIEEIFAKAVDFAVPAERAAFVAEACTGDPEAKDMVESLLATLPMAKGFLV